MNGSSVFFTYTHHRDFELPWLNAFIGALQDLGVKTFIDISSFKPQDDSFDIAEEALRRSDTIIAVVSGTIEKNSNVLFELGYAVGTGKRLIFVANPSSMPLFPSDLTGLPVITLGGTARNSS
jgi:TIR domain